VLVLCYFYPPLAGGGVHRVLGFTRGLPAHGWDCTVVCAGEEDYWVTDPTLAARVPEGTEVIRVAGGSALSAWLRVRRGDRGRRPGGTFSALRRLADWWLLPDSYAGWARRARAVAARRLAAGGVDALLSSSPPDSVHLAAAPLARRFGVPWVADFRDPWIGLAFRTPPTAWHRARQAAMERRVLEGADLVLVASRTHAESLGRAPGPPPARVEHLPNGYEPAAAAAAAGAAAAPADGAAFTLVFTGTLSQMPDAEVVFEALRDLLARRPEARGRLRVEIAGPYDSNYEDRAAALGLGDVVAFLGPVTHARSRALQRGADLLLLWKPRGAPTMVPGKLYEYLDAGRPVLAILPPGDEAARLAADGGAERVDPGDRAALAAVLERRWRAWADGAPSVAPRPAWLDDHARPRLAARLAGLLDGLAAGAAAPRPGRGGRP